MERGARRQRPAVETREHVLRTARELFYWEGIGATGVDRISSMAGVAPTTLYRLFESKDHLIAAYIEREDRLYREWFNAALDSAGPDPRERILALFEALLVQMQPEVCRGCPFQMALAEFPDPDHLVHQRAVDNKTWVRGRFSDLVYELAQTEQSVDPEATADELYLLFEGVYASIQSLGIQGPAGQARILAERVISSSSP